MTDGESKQRVSMTLPESLVEMLDRAVANAPDWLTVSRSELFRYGWGRDLEQWDGDVMELIPDEQLSKYKVKRGDEKDQAEYYVVDKREGWRGRVKSRLNARLAGEEPYHPRGIQILANGYKSELERLHELAPESSRSLEEDQQWLRQQVQDYRDAYHAKVTVPNPWPFDGVDDEVAVGRDLLQLRGDLVDVVHSIEAKAEATAYDPDAIVQALAAEWAVSEDAINLVIEQLVPDGVDTRQALKGLEADGAGIIDIVPDDVIEEHRVDPKALPEDAEVRMGGQLQGHAVGEELVESVLDADLDTEETVEVDPEALREALQIDGEAADD